MLIVGTHFIDCSREAARLPPRGFSLYTVTSTPKYRRTSRSTFLWAFRSDGVPLIGIARPVRGSRNLG
jgi:hypothetical protein